MVSQNSNKLRRILAIDGGGIKGVFPASLLAHLEDKLENKIANYFDLIVGTSTGGIIALALGLGFTAKEVLAMYEDFGSEVFKGNNLLNNIKQFFTTKYNPAPLRKVLESNFKDKKLGESFTRLVIPCMNLETGEVHVYKTAHAERLEMDLHECAIDIAMQTAAAPTFFPSHKAVDGIPLIDGGIWANNPVGLAVVESIAVLNWEVDSLNILSIGCTTEPLNIGIGRHFPVGALYWGWQQKIIDLFLTAQSSASIGTACLLANHRKNKNVFRISPSVPKNRFALDSIKEMSSLKGLGKSEARKYLPDLKERFFNIPADPFVPHHKLELITAKS